MKHLKVLLVSNFGVKTLGYHTEKIPTGIQKEVSEVQPMGLPVTRLTRMESWLRSVKVQTTERVVEVLPLPKFQREVAPFSETSENCTEGFSESI